MLGSGRRGAAAAAAAAERKEDQRSLGFWGKSGRLAKLAFRSEMDGRDVCGK